MKDFFPSTKNKTIRSTGQVPSIIQSGQVALEYILLLVVAVSICTLLVRSLVSRDDTEPGIITAGWRAIISTVGQDLADDLSKAEEE